MFNLPAGFKPGDLFDLVYVPAKNQSIGIFRVEIWKYKVHSHELGLVDRFYHHLTVNECIQHRHDSAAQAVECAKLYLNT